jgi:uncharacterized protein YegL
MKLCDADACGSCPLAADLPCCLRRKAQFCRLVARRRSAKAIRSALQTMASQLMKEAAALERESIVLARIQ